MNNILILYPEPFNCYDKFKRKINFLIQNITYFSISYINDQNGFINELFNNTYPEIKLNKIESIKTANITHGIIFDDSEAFPDEVAFLISNCIPLKIIKILITRVINIKKEIKYQHPKSTPKYEYIGRGSYWGNPYSMYEKGDDRAEVIRKYKYDFDFNKFPNKDKSEVYKLAGKRLGCFCKPQSCHGDVLADFLNSWDDEK